MSARELGILAGGLGFLAALVLVPLSRLLAVRAGILDRPDDPGGRKLQRQPIPLLGGVAVAAAAAVALVTVGWNRPEARTTLDVHGHILLAGAIVFLVGLIDDLFKDRIGPLPKFLGQCLAVAVLFHENLARVVSGDAQLAALLHFVALFLWMLTVINAVNFVDNMNGLCPGLAAISLLVGLVGVAGVDNPRWAALAGALGGATLGFLPYNFPRARIYLGDAGSHLLGYFLALLTLEFTSGFLSAGARFYGLDAFIPAILLLGVPLFDILFSVVRRHREGRPLFHGDARHLSHRLVGAGLDPVSAVLMLWGVQMVCAGAGVFVLPLGAAGRWGVFAFVLLFLSILAAVLVRVERERRRRLLEETSALDPAAENLRPEELEKVR